MKYPWDWGWADWAYIGLVSTLALIVLSVMAWNFWLSLIP